MTSKRIAASLAAVITVSASIGHYPVCTQKAEVKAPSVREFADSVMPMLQSNSNTMFESICYNKEENRLLRDGKRVPKDAVPGFRVIDGELRIAASETVRSGETTDPNKYLSLEEAAPLIGLETHETADGICVSEPFQSGTLIVKADSLSDTKGASEVGGGWNDLHVLQYPTAADAYAAYKAFQKDDSIVFAEPNRTYHVENTEVKASSGYEFPADNWGWDAVGAGDFLTKYEEGAASAPDVVVAVVDTGIYSDHNWFRGRIADGGTAFVPDNDTTYEDGNGHGTHCSGIICGMTPDNVKILPVKCLSDSGYGSSLSVFCSMIYAAEQNVDVVSMSLGGDGCDPLMEEAVRTLTEKEIPCVVAAGNEVDDAKHHSPANVPDAITVSSLSNVFDRLYLDYGYEDTRTPAEKANAEYWLSPYSNYGERIDFAAPGDSIRSAFLGSPDSTYEMSGTSMACPHVAACIADILTIRNDYSINEVYECLKSNVYDLGDTGFDSKYGWGMVNISNPDFGISALQQPESSVIPGKYSKAFTVTLSTPEQDAEIRYTTDGTYPDIDAGILYQGEEILIDNTTDLYAVTVKDGKRSARAHWHYSFAVNAPDLSPKPGNYDEPISVTLPASVADNAYYTLDGSDPDPATAIKYTGPIEITETTLLKVVVVIGRYVSEPFGYYYAIDGQTSDLMFESENGVLTHYYGCYAELDLNDYFAPGEITMIGSDVFRENEDLQKITLPDSVVAIDANAFYACSNLTSVIAPGVESIGKCSFRHCSHITKFDAPNLKTIGTEAFYEAIQAPTKLFAADNQIREIGVMAFENSGLSEAVLPNLEKLGSSAFGSARHLRKAVLPASITALPYAVFSDCTCLSYLDAPNVTELGDFALYINESYDAKILEYCTIDFSKLTSIGSESLPVMLEQADSVSFDALTNAGMYAFAFYNAESLHLPALKNVTNGVFDGIDYTSFVYLENAESIEPGALNPQYKYSPVTFIFGDHVKSGQKNPLISQYTHTTIAAPADSPMIRFAKAAHYPYCTTPDIYVPSDFCTRIQYETVPLVKCVPLAEYCRIEYTVTAADYDFGYIVPEQPLYEDENGKLFVDTTAPGTVTLRADLIDNTDTVLTSKTLVFTITSTDSGNVVTEAGMVFANWKNADVREIHEKIAGFDIIDYVYSYSFRFVPEKSCEYYLVSVDLFTEVSVYNEQNEKLFGPVNWITTPDQSAVLGSLEMKAGESYRIVMETKTEMAPDEFREGLFPFLMIQETEPTKHLGQMKLDQAYYKKGTLPDDMPGVTVYSASGSTVLKEGRDYKVYVLRNSSELTVFVYGIGAYMGIDHKTACIYEDDYTIGETIDLTEIQPNETLIYRVTKDADEGCFILSTEYSDAYWQDFASGKPMGDWCVWYPSCFDSEGELIEGMVMSTSGKVNPDYEINELVIPRENLEEDVFYFRTGNGGDQPIPAGMVKLTSRNVDPQYAISMCNIEYENVMRYTGKKVQFVKSIKKPNGERLEEGKDYLVYMNNDCIPGHPTLVVRGIGDYYGTIDKVVAIAQPESFNRKTELQPITPNEPFRLTRHCCSYILDTDSSYQCRLQKTDSPDPDSAYIYTIYKYDKVSGNWNLYPDAYSIDVKRDEVLDLDAGTYLFYIAQYDEEMELVLETMQETLTGISKAEIHSKTLTYTGEELTPDITLTYEDETLTEDEDYVLFMPEKKIIEPGIYNVNLAGIGKFSGECDVCVIVKPEGESGHQDVTTGSNALEITEPGKTAAAIWVPDHEHYGISLNELHLVSLVVYDPETNREAAVLDGSGYLYDFFDVTPGHEYAIYASWVEPQRTDAICFTLLSDFINLTECTVEGQNQMMFTQPGLLPEYTVRNGETVLQQDTDYSIYYSGANCDPGHALISLIGTGNSIGELSYHYYLYPETDAATFDADEEKTALKLNKSANTIVLKPGDMQRFEFEATQDGTYSFDRPDPEDDGVCVFAFGPDMEILPLDADQVILKKGEKLRLLAVTEHIDSYMLPDVTYSLTVTQAMRGYEVQVGDNVYQVLDGVARLNQYVGDHIGIQLPNTIYDPDKGAEIPVKGCTSKLLAEIGSSVTFYCEPGSESWNALRLADACFAAPDPQTGIKGDLTGDGTVNGNDWLTLMRWLNECSGMLMSESAFALSDMNEDGCLNLLDANAIMAIVNPGQE